MYKFLSDLFRLGGRRELTDEERYLFATHSEEEISRWSAALRWFRFCRAKGGRADDGDSFQASILFGDESELARVIAALGVELRALPPDSPKPPPGTRHTRAESAWCETEVEYSPLYYQPDWVEIAGVRTFVWVSDGRVVMHLSGGDQGDNAHAVTQRDFENARKIERHLAAFDLRFARLPGAAPRRRS